MNRTFNLDDVYRKISCFSVMTVKHKDRCEFIKRVKDCTYIMNLFRYYAIMYCGMKVDDRGSELLVILLYAVIIFFQMLLLQLLIEKYLCQIVKIIIIKLKLNEYLAGITLVAFCNSVPEMMTNLMPIRSMSPIYSINMSAGLSVILLAGGTICYLRSFQINKACALRDILCLILVSEVTLYFIILDGKTKLSEACVFITVYTVYLTINIIDLKLSRNYIKKLKEKIDKIKTKDLTIRDHEELSGLETTLTALEADNTLVLYNYRNTYYYDNMIRKSISRQSTNRRSTVGRSSRVIPREAGIDMDNTRDILHNPQNPKNMFIFSEFRQAIWPVDREEWRISGWCGRGLLLLIAPFYFLTVILIPSPNYTADKHGWSKLLNCFQMIISPFFCTLIIHNLIKNTYDEYTMHIELNVAVYSFGITVPLAIAMLIHSRTDKPPSYHFIFAIIGFTTTALSLMLCVTEMKVLFSIIGLAFDLSEDYVAVNLCVLATSVIDVIVNSSFAKQGYERMAFAASLASPIVEMSLFMGLICLVNVRVQEIGSTTWLIGVHGYITRVFFLITIVSYLTWGLTYNFFTRRSIGIYSFIIYALFCLYLLLAEFDVIYDITFLSPYIKPQ